MATTPKNTPATVGSPPVEPAPENEIVAPRAVVLTHRAAAADVAPSLAAFTKAKSAAKEALDNFDDSFAAAKDGILAINAKAFEALRGGMESFALRASWGGRSSCGFWRVG